MNSLFRKTNSWQWLLIAMAVCLLVGSYLSHLVWTKGSQKNGPELEAMKSHRDDLVLLIEEDAMLLERQASDIQKQLVAYEAVAQEQVGEPIPEGEQSVLMLGNEINRALLKHDLRVVEQEQVEVRRIENSKVTDSGNGPQSKAAKAAAKAAKATEAAKEAEQQEESLPFDTREIHYVVEGEYKQMFMFLIRQSHLKPSYHYKDIKITPSPQAAGMRMKFTVQIHFI